MQRIGEWASEGLGRFRGFVIYIQYIHSMQGRCSQHPTGVIDPILFDSYSHRIQVAQSAAHFLRPGTKNQSESNRKHDEARSRLRCSDQPGLRVGHSSPFDLSSRRHPADDAQYIDRSGLTAIAVTTATTLHGSVQVSPVTSQFHSHAAVQGRNPWRATHGTR